MQRGRRVRFRGQTRFSGSARQARERGVAGHDGMKTLELLYPGHQSLCCSPVEEYDLDRRSPPPPRKQAGLFLYVMSRPLEGTSRKSLWNLSRALTSFSASGTSVRKLPPTRLAGVFSGSCRPSFCVIGRFHEKAARSPPVRTGPLFMCRPLHFRENLLLTKSIYACIVNCLCEYSARIAQHWNCGLDVGHCLNSCTTP